MPLLTGVREEGRPEEGGAFALDPANALIRNSVRPRLAQRSHQIVTRPLYVGSLDEWLRAIGETGRATPQPDHLLKHGRTALGERVLNTPEAQGEPVVVQPHDGAHDLGREAITWIQWRHLSIVASQR